MGRCGVDGFSRWEISSTETHETQWLDCSRFWHDEFAEARTNGVGFSETI